MIFGLVLSSCITACAANTAAARNEHFILGVRNSLKEHVLFFLAACQYYANGHNWVVMLSGLSYLILGCT